MDTFYEEVSLANKRYLQHLENVQANVTRSNTDDKQWSIWSFRWKESFAIKIVQVSANNYNSLVLVF